MFRDLEEARLSLRLAWLFAYGGNTDPLLADEEALPRSIEQAIRADERLAYIPLVEAAREVDANNVTDHEIRSFGNTFLSHTAHGVALARLRAALVQVPGQQADRETTT